MFVCVREYFNFACLIYFKYSTFKKIHYFALIL